jgi:2-oxo-3-hexenedioate decarboxylase
MAFRGNADHDRRLDPGHAMQRSVIAAAEREGAQQVGWKAGFGAPSWRERFDLDAPLVGVLLDRTELTDGMVVSIGSWSEARAEAEVAVRLGHDLPAAATPEQAIAAVVAIAPAIELVDVSPAPEGPSEALAGNIFHRHWMTGAFLPVRGANGFDDLAGDVLAMGTQLGPVTDLEAATGSVAETLSEVARIGARSGRGLQSGDVVILGSITPPIPIAPGGGCRFTLRGHAPIEVRFSD